jgi:hypothetical protein
MHVKHKIALCPLGTKGTRQLTPHSVHCTTVVLAISPLRCARSKTRQSMQRFGRLANPFWAKNCCSLIVKTKSVPQATHFRERSTNSSAKFISLCPRINGAESRHMSDARCIAGYCYIEQLKSTCTFVVPMSDLILQIKQGWVISFV